MSKETYWVELRAWRLFPGRTVAYQPGDQFEIDPTQTPEPDDLALVKVDGDQVLQVVPEGGFPADVDVLGKAINRMTVAGLGPDVDLHTVDLGLEPFLEVNLDVAEEQMPNWE